jgi:predicted patatin/cPLA2 family phospholipase
MLRIEPVEKASEKEDDDEKNGAICCCYEQVNATAKNIEEALEKIKGIVGLSAKKGEKPKNIIAEYLKG